MEHGLGGDPRLVVGVDTPYGAVLDDPFTPSAWRLLSGLWSVAGGATLATLAAAALALATFGWGLGAKSAVAGALAATTALLVFHAGAGPMDALAFGLLGVGLYAARWNHPVVQILAGPLWAAAAVLAPGWAAWVPLLAATTAQGRGFEARATLAISLFASAALLGGDTWLVQAWMMAAVVPLLQGLPITPKARGVAVLVGTTLATAAALASYTHTAHGGTPHTSLWIGAALVVAGALAALAWRGWTKQGMHIPTVPALLAAALALAGLTAQTLQPGLRVHPTDTAALTTTQACTATPQDLDDALDWMADAGVRRLAAPADIAWALLVRDGERALQGNATGLSVVDAGLGDGPQGSRAARDNLAILDAARHGTLELVMDTTGGTGEGDVVPDALNTEPSTGTGTEGSQDNPTPTDAKADAARRGEGEQASWKRSIGAVVLCGDAPRSAAWTPVGPIQTALVAR